MTQSGDSDIRERALELVDDMMEMAYAIDAQYHRDWIDSWWRRAAVLTEDARREELVAR